jgi:hypothetical protein
MGHIVIIFSKGTKMRITKLAREVFWERTHTRSMFIGGLVATACFALIIVVFDAMQPDYTASEQQLVDAAHEFVMTARREPSPERADLLADLSVLFLSAQYRILIEHSNDNGRAEAETASARPARR